MIDKKTLITNISIFAGLVIVLILVMLLNLNLGFVKTLSISNIGKARKSLETAKTLYDQEEQTAARQKLDMVTAQDAFREAKNEYSAISPDTIKIVQDVTKEQKYLIEYLWIELGDYAINNHLRMIVLEPNTKSTFTVKTSTSGVEIVSNTTSSSNSNSSGNSQTDNASTKITINTDKSTVKIMVVGTYQNIADYVFEIENDKDLRFKLDNISMTYADNNYVIATFDVLDMSVLMK